MFMLEQMCISGSFSGSVEKRGLLLKLGLLNWSVFRVRSARLSATFTLHDGYDAHSGVNKYQYRIDDKDHGLIILIRLRQ